MDFAEFQKTLDGLPEEEKQAKIKDHFESLYKDVEFYKGDAKKAADKREEFKRTVDSLTEKIKELESKGDSSAELDSLKTELENVKKERDSFKTDADNFKAEIENINSENKKELLERLPDGEEKQFAEKLGLAELREYVKIHSVPSVDRSSHIRRPLKSQAISTEEYIKEVFQNNK